MRVGVFQFEPKFGAVRENLDRIAAAIRPPVDLVVLPELCTSGYQFTNHYELEELAEEIPSGPSISRFIEIAGKTDCTIVAGLPERDGGRFYNSAVVVNGDGVLGTYRKIHLFYEEKDLFTPGNSPLEIFDIGAAKIGVLICFDWIFPEATRNLALQGAEIICLPSNLLMPYCQDAMVTRAIENQVYTVVANRIGFEARGGKKPMYFTGNSQIADCKGNVLYKGSGNKQEFHVEKVHPTLAHNKWITERNNIFEDRRPEFYESISLTLNHPNELVNDDISN